MENKKIKMYGRSKQVIVEVPKPRKETKRLPKEIKEWLREIARQPYTIKI